MANCHILQDGLFNNFISRFIPPSCLQKNNRSLIEKKFALANPGTKSSVMKIELLPSESAIDTWNILYLPPGGGKYNGKLTITNKRLLYDARFDAAAEGFLPEEMFKKWGKEGYVEIFKSDIREINVEKSVLVKKAIITLADGTKHTFNYGVLNIDKVVAALHNN